MGAVHSDFGPGCASLSTSGPSLVLMSLAHKMASAAPDITSTFKAGGKGIEAVQPQHDFLFHLEVQDSSRVGRVFRAPLQPHIPPLAAWDVGWGRKDVSLQGLAPEAPSTGRHGRRQAWLDGVPQNLWQIFPFSYDNYISVSFVLRLFSSPPTY